MNRLLSVLAIASLVGCSGHTSGAGNEPLPVGVATYAAKVGGTLPLAPGQQVGYALTATALETYQFRWTGDAAATGSGYREFYGSVWTVGHFTSVTPGCVGNKCPLESGDYVSAVENIAGGERIDWDTFASDGWDGFSFTVDSEPVYFDVYVDGLRHADLFYFPSAINGSAPTNPATTPFGITSTN